MYCKLCPVCKKNSYSATKMGKWICPYCNADLTNIVFVTPEKFKNKSRLNLTGLENRQYKKI